MGNQVSRYQTLFIGQVCGRRRVGASSDFDKARCCSARLCGITPTRQGSRPWGRACQVNVHVHTLKASKAKGLCQLVSRNRPQSWPRSTPTRDKVERSLARRNRIKSSIAALFEALGVWGNRGKESTGVNICMSDPTAEANFLNKRATRAAGIIRFNLLRRNGKWWEEKEKQQKRKERNKKKLQIFSVYLVLDFRNKTGWKIPNCGYALLIRFVMQEGSSAIAHATRNSVK